MKENIKLVFFAWKSKDLCKNGSEKQAFFERGDELRKKILINYCIMIGYWQGNSWFGRRKIDDFKYVKIFVIQKTVLEK